MKLFQIIIWFSIICIAPIQFLNAQNSKKKISTNITSYSEDFALECVNDYYVFYNADECYREPKVRRVSSNMFYISLKCCSVGKSVCYTKENIGILDPIYIEKPDERFWQSKVLILTCTSKKKYSIRVKNTYE